MLIVAGGRRDATDDEGKAPVDGSGRGGVGEDAVGGGEGDGAVAGVAVPDFDTLDVMGGRHFGLDELCSKGRWIWECGWGVAEESSLRLFMLNRIMNMDRLGFSLESDR